MLKIVLTGPESSGKTTLAKQLGGYFQAKIVLEYARVYIDGLDREYEEKDLLKIGKGQIALEETTIIDSDKLLFCDTDLLTIKVWSDYKYDKTNPWILQQINQRYYDLYLLCTPDIPWEEDPQRENPNDRALLFEIYKNELDDYNKNYVVIKGGFEERLQRAIREVEKICKF